MAYGRNKYSTFLEDKTWNMDALFTERINDRLNDLDVANCEANQLLRYRILQTIFIDTHFKYIDKVPELKRKFKEVKSILNTPTSTHSKSGMIQHQSIIITQAEESLDDLSFIIMSLLYECDLICLKIKKGINPEQEFENDYK